MLERHPENNISSRNPVRNKPIEAFSCEAVPWGFVGPARLGSCSPCLLPEERSFLLPLAIIAQQTEGKAS